MKIIEGIEQGSSEWLKLRLSHVTATDASAIIGVNPYKDALGIYNDKLGLSKPQPVTAAMRRGTELEPIARKYLNEETGIQFNPAVVIHDTDTFMLASLDGLSEDRKSICEIKCPGIGNYQIAISGIVLPYHMAQIQHQLYCTGADLCYYCNYFEDGILVMEVKPDSTYIDNMVAMEREFFFEYLCKFKPPGDAWTLNLRK